MRERSPAPALPLLAFFVFSMVACVLALVDETPDHAQGVVVVVEVGDDFWRESSPYDLTEQPDAPTIEPQPWPDDKLPLDNLSR
jgi:hypothetical protein